MSGATANESPDGSARPAFAPLPTTERSGRWAVLVVLALLLAVCAAYRNTLTAPFVWDDGGSIADNPTVHHLATALHPPPGGLTVSGRPLMNLSLALNYAMSGEAPWSYHLTNLLVHFLAGCTLFGLVRRTLRLPPLAGRFGADATWLGGVIAAVWLVHPVQTEAVTYISQRTESLAGLFFLLTFYAFVRGGTSPHPRRWYVAAVAACLLGVGTKETIATAPLLVLLFDRTFVAGTFRRAWSERRWLYVALAATWIPLGLLVAGDGWNRGGTVGLGAGVTPWAYWATQPQALTRYLVLTFWPHAQNFDYGTFWVPWTAALPYLAFVVPLLIATVVALIRWPPLGFLGAWFFVILAPTSLVPGTIQMIVEHRMYLPLAALVTGAVLVAYAGLGRRSFAVWGAVGVVLAALTWQRNRAYASDVSLWSDTVAKAPENARAHYMLGIAYSEAGQVGRAVEEGRAAIAHARPFYAAKAFLFYNKLGHDLVVLGQCEGGIDAYQHALAINPQYAIAHLNLARALEHLNRLAEAIPHFEAALQRGIGGAPAEAELSDVLMQQDRPAEAALHLRAALRGLPEWGRGWNNLGYALLLAGQTEPALVAYRAAVRLSPGYAPAWVGLGYALVAVGHPADAIAPCTEAVRLAPGFADAQNTLGIAYAQSGSAAQAIPCFERAAALNPGAADVRNNLGNALAAVGRTREAVAAYREAVRLDPDYAPAQRNLGEELRRSGDLVEAAEHLAIAARLEGQGRGGR